MPKVQAQDAAAPSRAARGRRITSSLAEINVVPLVDVMLVLLIIFMVAAPMIQRGVDVNLPVAARATQIEGERIFVSVPADFRQKRIVYLGEEGIRVDALQERIRQAIEPLADKQVFLRGDATLYYQELMDIIDRLKAAGVEKVGLETSRPGDR
jgi:biopolymer transport protein ExbD